MPITVGPGSIAVAITLGSQRPRGNLAHMSLLGAAAVAGLIAIAATIYHMLPLCREEPSARSARAAPM